MKHLMISPVLSWGRRLGQGVGPYCVTLALLLFVLCPRVGHAQGMVQLRFEGPPELAPGSGIYVQQYFESGVWFRPRGVVGAGNGFDLQRGGEKVPFYPENGTAYVQAALTDSLMFSFVNGSLFNLVSVDLAEYSTVVPDARTVHFIGYRMDGSMVTTAFTTDGIIDGTGPVADFETFYFGPGFSGLRYVEVPGYGWSLDNLVFSIPEPGIGSLAVLGLAFLGCRQWRKNKRTRKGSVQGKGRS